jgi:hypothetical protein
VDRDTLFLRTLDDLDRRIKARRDEYEVMAIAGLLRKLLLDADPLLNQVNRTRGLRIRFVTSLPASMSNDDLPEPPPPGAPPFVRGFRTVTRDGLMSRFAAWIAPHEYSVKDLILYVANVKGGIHAGTPRDDREAVLEKAGSQIRVGGFDPSVYALFGIAEVVLKGLEPLRQRVEADVSLQNKSEINEV